MKVTFEQHYKNIYTVSQLESAKQVIAYEKENDDSKPTDWLKYAVSEALKHYNDLLDHVIEASAETCLNFNIFDAYGQGSGYVDVWVQGIAKTYEGFIEVGAYLSDIWQTSLNYDYYNRMWVNHYVREVK